MMDWKLVRQKRTKVCFVQKQSEPLFAGDSLGRRKEQLDLEIRRFMLLATKFSSVSLRMYDVGTLIFRPNNFFGQNLSDTGDCPALRNP